MAESSHQELIILPSDANINGLVVQTTPGEYHLTATLTRIPDSREAKYLMLFNNTIKHMDLICAKKLIIILFCFRTFCAVGFSQSVKCDILDYRTIYVKKRFFSKKYVSPKSMSLGELRTLRFYLKECSLNGDSLSIQYEILANTVSPIDESLVDFEDQANFDLVFAEILHIENHKESDMIRKIILREEKKIHEAGVVNSTNFTVFPLEKPQFNLIFLYKGYLSLCVSFERTDR